MILESPFRVLIKAIIRKLPLSAVTVCLVITVCILFIFLAPHGTPTQNPPASDWVSIRTGEPVWILLWRSVPRTFFICAIALGSSILISFAIALALLITFIKSFSLVYRWLILGCCFALSALPMFFAAYLIILISLRQFSFFPLPTSSLDMQGTLGWAYYLPPLFTLAIFNGEISEMVNYFYSALLQQSQQPYIRTARMKRANLWVHLFPLGMGIPILTMFVSKVPLFLSQAVIVEAIFNFYGVGYLAWQSAKYRDYPVLLGMIILFALLIRTLHLTKDICYQYLYPPSRG